MSELRLPDKIGWWMDLSLSFDERWSRRSLKNVQKSMGKIDELVRVEMMRCEAIETVFWPLYQKTVMEKSNYHLNVDETREKIVRMSGDPEYQVMVFFVKETGELLGGNVLHVLPNVVKTAYRCYNHALTREMGMKIFDYYADYKLQEQVIAMGGSLLSRGLMKHPCDGVGLSLFKIRTGAIPLRTKHGKEIVYSEQMIEEQVERGGVFGYFDQADSEGKYRSMTAVMKQELGELEKTMRKSLARVGIELRIELR